MYLFQCLMFFSEQEVTQRNITWGILRQYNVQVKFLSSDDKIMPKLTQPISFAECFVETETLFSFILDYFLNYSVLSVNTMHGGEIRPGASLIIKASRKPFSRTLQCNGLPIIVVKAFFWPAIFEQTFKLERGCFDVPDPEFSILLPHFNQIPYLTFQTILKQTILVFQFQLIFLFNLQI